MFIWSGEADVMFGFGGGWPVWAGVVLVDLSVWSEERTFLF
jgi:hypothetical protein